MEPECIVFDEPTAMLDPRGRREVMNVIHRLNEKGISSASDHSFYGGSSTGR